MRTNTTTSRYMDICWIYARTLPRIITLHKWDNVLIKTFHDLNHNVRVNKILAQKNIYAVYWLGWLHEQISTAIDIVRTPYLVMYDFYVCRMYLSNNITSWIIITCVGALNNEGKEKTKDPMFKILFRYCSSDTAELLDLENFLSLCEHV